MTAIAPGIDNLTLNITEETHIRASLAARPSGVIIVPLVAIICNPYRLLISKNQMMSMKK